MEMGLGYFLSPTKVSFLNYITLMVDVFTDNAAVGRYELDVDGAVAYARYRIDADTLYIDYVEAPLSLRGTGAAGRLMTHVSAHAKTNGYKIVPICGYAAAWLARHA